MKNFVIFAIILFAAANASAADPGMGFGFILGEPTGLSFKGWLDNKTAIDAAAAWSFSENDSFQFHADYLIHPFHMPKPREIRGPIHFYYGFGGRLKLRSDDGRNARNDDDDIFGIRFPLGFAHMIANPDIEFFAELVPILDLVPDSDVDINAAIGARFYF